MTSPRQESLQVANLVLAGVGKAGTTSLFWYLSQHPDICRSRVKETRYFLPMSEVHAHPPHGLEPLAVYSRQFTKCRQSRYRMEATPHYFHGGRTLARAIDDVLPDVRVILTLRDPVNRAWSIYRFAKHMLMLPREVTFEQFVDRGIAIHAAGTPLSPDVGPYWTAIRGSLYAEFIPAWIEQFAKRVTVVFFEKLIACPEDVTGFCCRWLELDDRCTQSFRYSAENKTMAFRSRRVHRVAHALNSQRLLRDHRRIKEQLRRLYRLVNGVNSHETMSPDARQMLDEFFRPSNLCVATQLRGAGIEELPRWLSDGALNPAAPSA